jgi:hypothetical protein
VAGPEFFFTRLDGARGEFRHLAGQTAQQIAVAGAHAQVFAVTPGLDGDLIPGLIQGGIRCPWSMLKICGGGSHDALLIVWRVGRVRPHSPTYWRTKRFFPIAGSR